MSRIATATASRDQSPLRPRRDRRPNRPGRGLLVLTLSAPDIRFGSNIPSARPAKCTRSPLELEAARDARPRNPPPGRDREPFQRRERARPTQSGSFAPVSIPHTLGFVTSSRRSHNRAVSNAEPRQRGSVRSTTARPVRDRRTVAMDRHGCRKRKGRRIVTATRRTSRSRRRGGGRTRTP